MVWGVGDKKQPQPDPMLFFCSKFMLLTDILLMKGA